MKNGMAECSACRSRLVSPSSKAIARAYEYDNHKIRVSSKQRALNVFLVVGDCMLVGLQVNLLLPCIYDHLYICSIISLLNHVTILVVFFFSLPIRHLLLKFPFKVTFFFFGMPLSACLSVHV